MLCVMFSLVKFVLNYLSMCVGLGMVDILHLDSGPKLILFIFWKINQGRRTLVVDLSMRFYQDKGGFKNHIKKNENSFSFGVRKLDKMIN